MSQFNKTKSNNLEDPEVKTPLLASGQTKTSSNQLPKSLLKKSKKLKGSADGETAPLPRNIPRKVVGEIRKKSEKPDYGDVPRLQAGRVGTMACSYEISMRKLHKHMIRKKQLSLDQPNPLDSPGRMLTKSQSLFGDSAAPKGINSFGRKNSFEVHPLRHFIEKGDPRWADYDVDSTGWNFEVFFDVLHLSKVKPTSNNFKNMPALSLHEHMGSLQSDPETALGYDSMNEAVPLAQNYSDREGDADDESDPVPLEKPVEWLDVFVFNFGSVVFWNFDDEEQEKYFMNSISPFLVRRFKEQKLIDNASDNMDYVYSAQSFVKHNLVRLGTRQPEEKLAVSYAFAQSNLLSVFEWRLDKIISRNEHIPQELALKGTMKMSQEEIAKEIGTLFMERNSVNLASDILDTPVFFWENDEWDPVYSTMCKYLEHTQRIDVLNRRLDCVRELLGVLEKQADNKHASRLEWIVIWLITSEIFISLFWNILLKDILGFFKK